ncbi:MAG: hypothetical protein JNG89_21200, partial [Planctomycetaceae bacterium]|nr:hypothetical protein [Planctomycetaceae bacterium]
GSTHYEDGKIQFGGTVTTDDQGAFTLQSLAPGADVELWLVVDRDANGIVQRKQWLTLVRADRPGEVVELGDLPVEPFPDPVASADTAPPVDLNEVRAAVKPWLDEAFQIDDAARRDAAIEQVRSALASQDVSEQRKGLVAFTAMAEIQFDKAACHDLIVPLLSSAVADVRALAAQSLVISGIRDGDLERLNTLAGDSNSHAREQAAFPIVTAVQRDLTGAPAKDAILKLLNDSEESVRTETIHSLWGAKLSPEIEARIIEISRKQSQFSDGEPYQALYYALSTQANKSEASVKRLIEYLAHTDTLNVAGRAAWGLGAGVAPEQRSLVADAMLKVLSARSTGHLSNEALARLKQYAGAEQREGIRTLLEKPGIDTKLRTELEAIAASLPEGR